MTDWKRLSCFLSNQQPPDSWLTGDFRACSCYVDVNGKEWIVILLPHGEFDILGCDSYLYDVENDKFIPFVKNYMQHIDKKFNISHISDSDMVDHTTRMSYVIDNDNHNLYWLHSLQSQRSLVSLDIKNLQDIKLIDQTLLPSSIDGVTFFDSDYTMLMVGNTIEFILSTHYGEHQDSSSLANFQFDIKTKKFSLLHKNIHLKTVTIRDAATQLKLGDLKIGDYIDVKHTSTNNWTLAKVCDIKDKIYNDNDTDNDNDRNMYCSVKIFVHYVERNKRNDEWIQVSNDSNLYDSHDLAELEETLTLLQTYGQFGRQNDLIGSIDINSIIDKLKNGTSICDCHGECIYNDDIKSKLDTFGGTIANIRKKFNKCHRIAVPKTKSLYDKSLRNLHGFYLKSCNTMIMVGDNGSFMEKSRFGGIYCKRIGDDEKQSQLIVNGFIKQFKQLSTDIPKDLCQLIFKYYCLSNDNWIYMTKKDKNGMFVEQQYESTFYTNSRFVVIDGLNSSDNYNYNYNHIMIYKFGSSSRKSHEDWHTICRLNIDMETHSYKIQRLTSVKCPDPQYNLRRHNLKNYWRVVFLPKSQTIHLFDYIFTKHYSIKLETLLNAKTIEN